MQKTIKSSSAQIDLPIELQHLRVAAYCRVSTKQEEQSSSIELQGQHYAQWISENPNWENAGVFSERATGLNLQERPEFRKMIKSCQEKKIDLILTNIYQPLWTQYTGRVTDVAESAQLWYRYLF